MIAATQNKPELLNLNLLIQHHKFTKSTLPFLLSPCVCYNSLCLMTAGEFG